MSTCTSLAQHVKIEVGVAPSPREVKLYMAMASPSPRREQCEAMPTFFPLSLKEDNCVQPSSFSSFLAWPHLCSLQRGEAMATFSLFLVCSLVFPFLDLGKGEGGEMGVMAIS